MKSIIRKQNGFTLIELIVAIAIASLVIMVAASLTIFGYNTFIKGNRQSELQENTRLATDYIDKQIKYAGIVAYVEDEIIDPTLREKISIINDAGQYYLIHEKIDISVEPAIYREVFRTIIQVIPENDQDVFGFTNGTSNLLLNVNLPSVQLQNSYVLKSQIALPNIATLTNPEDVKLTTNSPVIYFAKGLASLSMSPVDEGGDDEGGGDEGGGDEVNESIMFVGISGLAIPEKGNYPDLIVAVASPSNFAISSIGWYDNSDNTLISSTTKYQNKKSYYAKISLTAASGYEFKPIGTLSISLTNPSLDSPNCTVSADGRTLTLKTIAYSTN